MKNLKPELIFYLCSILYHTFQIELWMKTLLLSVHYPGISKISLDQDLKFYSILYYTFQTEVWINPILLSFSPMIPPILLSFSPMIPQTSNRRILWPVSFSPMMPHITNRGIPWSLVFIHSYDISYISDRRTSQSLLFILSYNIHNITHSKQRNLMKSCFHLLIIY